MENKDKISGMHIMFATDSSKEVDVRLMFPVEVDSLDLKDLEDIFKQFQNTCIQRILFQRGVQYGK